MIKLVQRMNLFSLVSFTKNEGKYFMSFDYHLQLYSDLRSNMTTYY